MRLSTPVFAALIKIKSALLQNDEQALAAVFDQVDVADLLSEDTLNVVRARDQVPLVIFLASIAEANDFAPARAALWREVYQSLTAGALQGDLATRSPKYVLRHALESLLPGASPVGKKVDLRGDDQDWVDALELLVDRAAWAEVEKLLKRLGESAAPTTRWLRIAEAMKRRYDLYVDDFEQQNSAVDYAALARSFEEMAKAFRNANAQLQEVSVLSLAARSWEVGREFDTAARVWASVERFPGHTAAGKLGQARCAAKRNQYPQAIEKLDDALQVFAEQTLLEATKALGDTPDELAATSSSTFDAAKAGFALADLVKILADVGQRCFLVSGTLLGYAREGRLLDHDKDLDVGVVGWQNQYDIYAALIQSGQFKVMANYLRAEEAYYIPLMHVLTGISIDIFIYHPREDGKWVTGVPFNFGYTQRFAFTPFELKEVEFMGVPMNVPADMALNLQENFGDWQTPDKSYLSHLESPSTENKGALAHQMTGRLLALKALKNKNAAQLHKVAQVMGAYADCPSGMSASLLAQLETWARQCEALGAA